MKNTQEIEQDIEKLLENHPEGLTIQDISRTLGSHRQTVAKYILVLEAKKEIFVRRIGKVSLCYIKETFSEIKRLKR